MLNVASDQTARMTVDRMASETSDAAWIEALVKVLEGFKSDKGNLTVEQAILFLNVARHDREKGPKALADMSGITGGGASVTLTRLAKGRGASDGWGLITDFPSPVDGRAKFMGLTAEGHKLVGLLRARCRVLARQFLLFDTGGIG